jgi:ABC-type transport system substrate-binding protein
MNVLWFIGFDHRQKPLDDVRVRLAIAHAIDKPRVVALIPGSVPATGIQPAGWKYSVARAEDPYPYNPDKARALLRDVGVSSMTLDFFAGTTRKALAELLASSLDPLGVRLNLHLVASVQEIKDAVRTGRAHLFFLAAVRPFTLSDERRAMAWEFKSDAAWDLYHYKNESVDSALAEAAQEQNEERKRELFRKIEDMLLADVPVVPIAWSVAR